MALISRQAIRMRACWQAHIRLPGVLDRIEPYTVFTRQPGRPVVLLRTRGATVDQV